MSLLTSRSKKRPVDDSNSVPQRRSFSLSDTDTLGLRFQLVAGTLLIGLGTTATRIVDSIVRKIAAGVGFIPPSLDYQMIDGEAKEDLFGLDHFTCVGIAGCGTDSNEGRDAFLKIYPKLRQTFENMLLGLDPTSSHMPAAVPVQKCVEAFVFAGNGGSSGGMQQPCVTLLNEVMQRRGIESPRIHVVFLGPDMAMNDASRNVSEKQVEITAATAYANIKRMVSEHWLPQNIREQSPTGDFTLPAGGRVQSVNFVDQSNGRYRLGTTDEFVEMVASAYFAAICTDASMSVSARTIDMEKTGDTARAFHSSRGLSH